MAIAYAGIEVGLREVVLKDKPAAAGSFVERHGTCSH